MLPPATFQLVKTLIFPVELQKAKYTDIRDKLKTHLKPVPLRIPSRHALCTRRQREGETIPEFLASLRSLAIPCKYETAVLNEILKDIFVARIRSRSILDRLFTEPDESDLERLYTVAVGIEKAEASTQQLLSTPSTSYNIYTNHGYAKFQNMIPPQIRGKTIKTSRNINKTIA